MYKVQQINEEFILNESAEQAYLLGFITGDGCITQGRLQIDSSDKDLIEEFGRRLNSKIYEQPNLKKGSWRIQVHSNKILDYLNEFGITERKSYVGIQHLDYSEKFRADYLRGWIDSDGTIYKAGKPGNWGPGVELFVSKNGNELEIAKRLLESLGIQFLVSEIKGKPLLRIRLRRRTMPILRERVYYDGCLSLQRKYNRFVSLYEEWMSYSHYGAL